MIIWLENFVFLFGFYFIRFFVSSETEMKRLYLTKSRYFDVGLQLILRFAVNKKSAEKKGSKFDIFFLFTFEMREKSFIGDLITEGKSHRSINFVPFCTSASLWFIADP